MPTLSPGCHLVPRWRTMMLPARAAWPPNSFTPRRLLSLSRPLRDEPPAFLCAMSNYFALGDFLAAPLAGAAFSVEAALAVLPPPVLFLALAGLASVVPVSAGGLALASSCGAGLTVGLPATSPEPSAGVIAAAAFSFLAGAAAFAGAASALGAAFFSALWSPIATIRRIVCCWRWPFLRR